MSGFGPPPVNEANAFATKEVTDGARAEHHRVTVRFHEKKLAAGEDVSEALARERQKLRVALDAVLANRQRRVAETEAEIAALDALLAATPVVAAEAAQ